MLDRYCVTCHNERLKTAGLALDTLSVEEATEAASLEKVVRKLRTSTMPPAGRPRPAPELWRVAASLEGGSIAPPPRRPIPDARRSIA